MQIFKFGEYWDISTFLLTVLLGIGLCLFGRLGAIKGKKIYYFIIYGLLLFVYTFRGITHGADTGTYVASFQDSLVFNNTYNAGYEPLFKIVTFLIRHITDNYNIYFLLSGVLICSAYLLFIKTFWSKESGFSCIFLISIEFMYDMNIMRYAFAHSIFLIILCLLAKGKSASPIVLSLISILFHYTSIFTFLFVLVYLFFRKANNKQRISLFIVLIVFIVLMSIFAKIVLAGTRYAFYFESVNPTIIGSWKQIFFGLCAIIMMIGGFLKTEKSKVVIASGLFGLSLIPFVLINGAYRVPYFFLMPGFYLFQLTIDRAFGKRNRLLYVLVSFAFIVFYYLFDLSRRSQDYGFKFEFVEFEFGVVLLYVVVLIASFIILSPLIFGKRKKKYRRRVKYIKCTT